jgi:cytochrome c-type biogenesis protein CcmH/NrfF
MTAEEARDRIREKMRAGETKDAILEEYEAQYGVQALAVPPNRGALRAIWIVPVLGIALGAAGLAQMMRRWRRGSPPRAGGAAEIEPRTMTSKPQDAYDAQLDDELKGLDD